MTTHQPSFIKACFTAFGALLFLATASAQNQSLILSAPPNYVKVNAGLVKVPLPIGSDDPNIGMGYSGLKAAYSHNVAHSPDGSLLFFVVDGTIYNHKGWWVGDIYATSGAVAKGSGECLLIPFSNQCGRWMIISADVSSSLSSNPAEVYFKTFDYINQEITVVDEGLVYDGNVWGYDAAQLAVTDLTPDGSRLLFVHATGALKIYLIDGSGSAPSLIHTEGVELWATTGVRSEMEVVRMTNTSTGDPMYRVAFPYIHSIPIPNTNPVQYYFYHRIKLMDFEYDGTTTTMLHEAYISLTDDASFANADIPKGLEFSPSGEYLYYTHTRFVGENTNEGSTITTANV